MRSLIGVVVEGGFGIGLIGYVVRVVLWLLGFVVYCLEDKMIQECDKRLGIITLVKGMIAGVGIVNVSWGSVLHGVMIVMDRRVGIVWG